MKKVLLLALLLAFPRTGHASEKMRIEVVKMSVYSHFSPGAMLYSVTANILLPEGTHAQISCAGISQHCYKIESFAPEKMPPDSTQCDGDICTTTNLGYYMATRKGNELTIECPGVKLKFHIDGSW